ncbi:cytochrome C biosynthesis protein [Flavobacterium humi]|uniref:Cytochrome C biosynthesis protein n=2 Tax=Flavobacterium humi TaxID=2562683 RepID=A0A4Z0LAW4_9FLAO|nr:cytochrome C biosynthesis protein [Flavobacterium humi]
MIGKVSKIKGYAIGMFFISTALLAQTQPEDVALVSDDFQESYYESLMQKGMENYDKAIVSLEKCLKIQPENPVVYHELGKNYFFQKDYPNAEKAYIKATQLDSKNKWYLIDLYEVYYETKNYNEALLVVQKIVPFDKKYKEDLVSLYMYTQQFDKALVLMNELDETVGKTELRDNYRLEINSQTKNNVSNKGELEKAIENSPKNEENYISLIYLYTDNNQEDKAFQVAQKLEKNIPESEWAQVFLFKYHINENDGNGAAKSIERVFNGSKIDKKIKYRMYNEFLIFALKNPAFESQLNKVTAYFENDPEFDVHKEIGKFYYKKKSWDLAVKNLEKSFKNKNTDLETNIFLLASYEETNNYEGIVKVASELIDTFPNQPEYYFFAGKAASQLKNFKKANEILETGLDFVVENKELEIDFLNLLAEVSTALGNAKKSSEYLAKANNLKSKK